jgi:hypothetical protein
MEKKTMFAGLAVLMTLGLVLAASAAFDRGNPDPSGMRGNHTAMCQSLGLSENATFEEMREAMFDKRLTDMGLTEDSTIRELKAALKGQMQKMLKDMPCRPENAPLGRMFKGRAGARENVTFEDVPTALNGLGNRTCPMGRRGRGIDMMFGI